MGFVTKGEKSSSVSLHSFFPSNLRSYVNARVLVALAYKLFNQLANKEQTKHNKASVKRKPTQKYTLAAHTLCTQWILQRVHFILCERMHSTHGQICSLFLFFSFCRSYPMSSRTSILLLNNIWIINKKDNFPYRMCNGTSIRSDSHTISNFRRLNGTQSRNKWQFHQPQIHIVKYAYDTNTVVVLFVVRFSFFMVLFGFTFDSSFNVVYCSLKGCFGYILNIERTYRQCSLNKAHTLSHIYVCALFLHSVHTFVLSQIFKVLFKRRLPLAKSEIISNDSCIYFFVYSNVIMLNYSLCSYR